MRPAKPDFFLARLPRAPYLSPGSISISERRPFASILSLRGYSLDPNRAPSASRRPSHPRERMPEIGPGFGRPENTTKRPAAQKMRMGFIGRSGQDRTDLNRRVCWSIGFGLFDVSISWIVSFRRRKSKSFRRETLRSHRVGFYLACALSDKSPIGFKNSSPGRVFSESENARNSPVRIYTSYIAGPDRLSKRDSLYGFKNR